MNEHLEQNFRTWSDALQKYYLGAFAFLTGSGIYASTQYLISERVKWGAISILVGIALGFIMINLHLYFQRQNILRKTEAFVPKVMDRAWTISVTLSLIFTMLGASLMLFSFIKNVNCKNFSDQNDAQIYFEQHGGSKAYNASGLDRDHDGLACEDLKK